MVSSLLNDSFSIRCSVEYKDGGSDELFVLHCFLIAEVVTLSSGS